MTTIEIRHITQEQAGAIWRVLRDRNLAEEIEEVSRPEPIIRVTFERDLIHDGLVAIGTILDPSFCTHS